MLPKIIWQGKRYHNLVTTVNPERIYVENWVTAERCLVPTPCANKGELTINIPTDPRWIYNGNRNPSSEMRPEYLAIEADKWKLSDLRNMFPNRPLPLPTDSAVTKVGPTFSEA
jgi:hypothetical protein